MKKGILAALALGLLLPGCAKQNALSVPAVTPPGPNGPTAAPGEWQGSPGPWSGDPKAPETPLPGGPEYAAGRELFCLADSEKEAREIAALYGIELVDFSDGVATFHTEEDPHEVIRRGRENGWPGLSLNSVLHLDDPVPHASFQFS